MNHPISLAPAVFLQVLATSPKTEVIKSQLSIYPDFVILSGRITSLRADPR